MRYIIALVVLLTLINCTGSEPIVKRIYVQTRLPTLPLYEPIKPIHFKFKNHNNNVCIKSSDFSTLVTYVKSIRVQNIKYRNVINRTNEMTALLNQSN